MKKRFLIIMLVIVMLFSLFTGCQSNDASQKTDGDNNVASGDTTSDDTQETEDKDTPPEPVTLKMMMFGEKPLHMDEVLEEFYKRTEDILNVTLDIEFNPTADHKQKLLLIASAGEEYDMVFDAPWMHLETLSKDGAYIELDKYFLNDDYPGLKANFSEDYLESNKYFGHVYGVPITRYPASSEAIGIRTDLMDKYGYEEIQTYEELQSFFDDILENEPGMVPLATEGRVGFFRMFQPDFESYNIFPAGDFLVALSEDNTKVLGAVYKFSSVHFGGDSEEYIKDFPEPWNNLDKWYERVITYREWSKYLEEDVLSQTDPKGFFATGKAAALNRGYEQVTTLQTLEENLGIDTDLYTFPYMERDRKRIEGATYTDYKVWNFMCIPITSSKADRSMKFIDWVFQSEENHDLFELGIEGVHWEKVGDDKFKIPESLDSPYVFPWYQLTGTPNMIRYNVDMPETAVEFKKWQSNPDKYVLSPLAGFNMDYENVKTEKASIDAIYSEISTGIVNGAYDDPVSVIKEANANAMKAGLDKMREETIRQVQEFLDSKNK